MTLYEWIVACSAIATAGAAWGGHVITYLLARRNQQRAVNTVTAAIERLPEKMVEERAMAAARKVVEDARDAARRVLGEAERARRDEDRRREAG